MKFIRLWLPVFIWMAVIFFLSGRPSVRVAEELFINFLFFKSLHVIEYSILFALFVRALQSSYKFSNHSCMYLIAFLLTVIYAASDEIHQLYVPTREGKLRDVIIDAIGAGGVWIYLQLLLPRAPKKLQGWAKNWGII